MVANLSDGHWRPTDERDVVADGVFTSAEPQLRQLEHPDVTALKEAVAHLDGLARSQTPGTLMSVNVHSASPVLVAWARELGAQRTDFATTKVDPTTHRIGFSSFNLRRGRVDVALFIRPGEPGWVEP